MTKTRDWNKIIIQINEYTQKGKLTWRPEPANLDFFAGSDKRTEMYYIARFKNNRLRLYKEEFKNWSDEDHYTWDSRIVLEFIDDEGRTLWTFPRSAALWDLFETITYKTSNVEKAIEELLSGDLSEEDEEE